jgi:polyhydroxyalkanoate synthesis repressor PhaR
MKLIKRYKNRRLYDVDSSRTITQRELASIVRAGHDVTIIDSASGEDITLDVLGRVVISETSSWEDVKESKELFIKLISLGGDKSMSVLKNTILASIGAFNVTRAKAEKIIDDLIKKGDLDKSNRKKAVMELLDKAEKSTSQLRDKITKGADKTQKEITKIVKNINIAKKTDLKKLEGKVDKLAKSLKNIEKKLNQL